MRFNQSSETGEMRENDRTVVWEGKSEERVIEEGSNDAESHFDRKDHRQKKHGKSDSTSAIRLQEMNGQV